MEFNFEQMKDLIYVSNSFEEWSNSGKKEPVKITEEIPVNLWNFFRIFLYRFCDCRTELILPPVKKLPSDFLYGTFKKVIVSDSTEFICEGALSNAKIRELKIPEKTIVQNGAINKSCDFESFDAEVDLNTINRDEMKMFFGKIKAMAAFESSGEIMDFKNLVVECDRKNILKDRVKLTSLKQLYDQGMYDFDLNINNFLKKQNQIIQINRFSLEESLVQFDMGIKIRASFGRDGLQTFKCLAFLIQNDKDYLFVCVPFGISWNLTKSQLNQIPFVVEKLVEKVRD